MGHKHDDDAVEPQEDSSLAVKVGTMALSFAAGWVAQKAVTVIWKRATGNDAPTDLDDPEVSVVSAVVFASVAAGVGTLTKTLVSRHGKGLVRKVAHRS